MGGGAHGEVEVGAEVVGDLGEDAGEVYGVDGAEVVPVLELQLVEHLLHDVLRRGEERGATQKYNSEA